MCRRFIEIFVQVYLSLEHSFISSDLFLGLEVIHSQTCQRLLCAVPSRGLLLLVI